MISSRFAKIISSILNLFFYLRNCKFYIFTNCILLAVEFIIIYNNSQYNRFSLKNKSI